MGRRLKRLTISFTTIVGQGLLAGVRQCEVASRASQEFFAKRAFKRLNLRADGRLRDMEFGCRFGQTALLGHSPEVTQVMVIQEFHTSKIL
jgi:hypothetical protein